MQLQLEEGTGGGGFIGSRVDDSYTDYFVGGRDISVGYIFGGAKVAGFKKNRC